MATDTNIEALYEYYAEKISALTEEESKLTAAVVLDHWKAAEYAYRYWTERGTNSYSISGRQYIFKSRSDAENTRNNTLAELKSLLGGSDSSVSYVNQGGAIY